ncbi:MAG: hypothetical protein ACHQ0J_01280 [Candidatus Dormibacterales bacterium]
MSKYQVVRVILSNPRGETAEAAGKVYVEADRKRVERGFGRFRLKGSELPRLVHSEIDDRDRLVVLIETTPEDAKECEHFALMLAQFLPLRTPSSVDCKAYPPSENTAAWTGEMPQEFEEPAP